MRVRVRVRVRATVKARARARYHLAGARLGQLLGVAHRVVLQARYSTARLGWGLRLGLGLVLGLG